MYYNQPFCSNSFSKEQYNYSQTPQSPGLAPVILGEGDVTSAILPDGTCQYFFTPTVKWWSPRSTNICPPQCVDTRNSNYNNPYFNANVGVWFIRSITNPIPPFVNNGYLRHESPICTFSSDHNLNTVTPGYQLKFHNDGVTSTTDIHYFYPCLRQYDCSISLPAKGCAAVQVDTPMLNTCHYNIICSQPCNCLPKQNHLQEHQPMALDTSNKSEDICDCDTLNTCAKYGQEHIRGLLPSDESKKRIKLGKKSVQNTQACVCECPNKSIDKSTVMCRESGCGGGPESDVTTQQQTELSPELKQQLKNEWQAQKAAKSESKNVECECSSRQSPDKCLTTNDKMNSVGSKRKTQGQGCCDKGSNIHNAQTLIANENMERTMEMWCPVSECSKQTFECAEKDTAS